jgi:hypothetical protein
LTRIGFIPSFIRYHDFIYSASNILAHRALTSNDGRFCVSAVPFDHFVKQGICVRAEARAEAEGRDGGSSGAPPWLRWRAKQELRQSPTRHLALTGWLTETTERRTLAVIYFNSKSGHFPRFSTRLNSSLDLLWDQRCRSLRKPANVLVKGFSRGAVAGKRIPSDFFTCGLC